MKYVILYGQPGGRRFYPCIPLEVKNVCIPPTKQHTEAAAAGIAKHMQPVVGRMMGWCYFVYVISQGENIRGAEIGVDQGDGIARLLMTGVKHIDAVDPWIATGNKDTWTDVSQGTMDERYQYCKDTYEGDRVTIHRVSSEKYWETVEPSSLDWVYIDGNHYKEHVMVDAVGAYAALKKGGVIGFDDCIGTWEKEIAPVVKGVQKQFNMEIVNSEYDPWILRK